MRSHLEAVEVRLKQEEGERGRAEEECRHLRQQLTVSQDHSVSLQTTVTSLNEQVRVCEGESGLCGCDCTLSPPSSQL